jgi:two-component system, OmpR family, manganese sensing sensor histidine kinase
MGLGIDLNKTNNPRSPVLRWRLLLSYLTVMMAILGSSALAVYHYTRHSLYQQIDRSLEVLAQESSHNLLALETHHTKRQTNDAAINLPSSQKKCSPDNDGDLDIPWQQLRSPDRGIEWFDPRKKLIAKAGTSIDELPPQPGFQVLQQGKIRAVTLPAYSHKDSQTHLEGYIRATQVTQELEAVLSRLRWGLGLGGIGVLGLTGLGGIWLTRQSLKPIEQSFQQLKQFTADAAHELRSPLAAVKTSIQVMQCYPERLHPQDLKKIGAIASTTNHTIRLVEDLLLLARMDEAALTETQQWELLSIDEILEDLWELFQSSSQEKGIKLYSSLLTNVTVKGDETQLSRLFRNLLENALQYTPADGKVILTMKRSDRQVIISVEDTGIGIAPEDLPFIFDRFWRADKARSRREAGMGMGLAIANAIVQRHHGEITATSQLGVGSCFRVSLPLD